MTPDQQSDSKKIEEFDDSKIEVLKQKLSGFFQKYAQIAEQSMKKVRFLFILSTLAACW